MDTIILPEVYILKVHWESLQEFLHEFSRSASRIYLQKCISIFFLQFLIVSFLYFPQESFLEFHQVLAIFLEFHPGIVARILSGIFEGIPSRIRLVILPGII